MKASLVSACAVPPPGSSPAALEAALQTRLQEMARTKAAVEQELLQCRAQLDRAFAVTEQIAGLRDSDDIEEALLGHYGAMLHAGGVYLDRAGCTRRVGLSPGAMPPVDLVPADVRAALARHIESVRIGRKTIVVPAAPELGGAHVLLGAFARPGAEAGVVVVLRGRGAPAFETSDVLASESMLLYGAQILNNALTMCHLKRAAVETVYALVNAIDAKDNYTSDHSERVGLLARLTGQALGLPKERLQALEWAGLLHDVGKIGIPEKILNKPGRLTESEFAQMKNHPRIGHDMLSPVARFAPVLEAVLCHHENHDGSGYPEGLAGQQIPLDARIIHVADIFDALTTRRPYRNGYDRLHALRLLERDAGRVTDPHVTRIFIDALWESARGGANVPGAAAGGPPAVPPAS